MKEKRILIFSPLSTPYLAFLLFITSMLFPYLIYTGILFSESLGIPSYVVFSAFALSLVGSCLNLKVAEVESVQPLVYFDEVNFFGVRWRIPNVRYGRRKTVIAVNVGGALIPILFSIYLLLSLPGSEVALLVSYLKILATFLVVMFVVNTTAKPVKGLGIAVPSFIPPLAAAFVAAVLFPIYVKTNPFVMAYVAGTLGSLVGADLLNLDKVSKLGASIVSIGGAGMFDGVYMSGIMGIFLLWLFIS